MKIKAVINHILNIKTPEGQNQVSFKPNTSGTDVFEKENLKNSYDSLLIAIQKQEFLDKNPFLRKIINISTEDYSVEYLKFLNTVIKKYPDMAAKIKKNESLPLNFIRYDYFYERDDYMEREQRYVDKMSDFNPLIKKINKLLPEEAYIKWSVLIPKKCPKEKANSIIQTIYDSLKASQRLESRNHRDVDNWLIKNKTVIDCTTRAIEGAEDFNIVLKEAGKGYGGIFKDNRFQRGQLRQSPFLVTPFNQNSYYEYMANLSKMKNVERKSPFSDFELTQIKTDPYNVSLMIHPKKEFIPNAMKHAKENYNEIMKSVQKRVNGEKLSIKELKNAEDNIAQIHFIIANSVPFERGSAGVANVMTRSLYKALGVDLPPVKKYVALDLEAFCQPLDKYKKNWNTFFELP